jgi:hypothetical protein
MMPPDFSERESCERIEQRRGAGQTGLGAGPIRREPLSQDHEFAGTGKSALIVRPPNPSVALVVGLFSDDTFLPRQKGLLLEIYEKVMK